MRRSLGFVTLASAGLLTSAVAVPASAGGVARVSDRPAAVNEGHHGPSKCKPSFSVVASQDLGGSNTEGGLEDVVEVDKAHAYAVGVTETEDPITKTEAFSGLVDEGTGNHWTLNDDPGGSLKNDFLLGVDATASTDVWAAGFRFTSKGDVVAPVVLRKNAAGWHRVAVPHSTRTVTTSVVTVSPRDVYVGGLTIASGANPSTPVIFHFNGKTWRRTVFSSMTGEGVAAMTLAGGSVVAVVNNQTYGADGTDGPRSSVKYLKGSTWKTLAFRSSAALSAVSGSSIHDLWATSVDKQDDATDVVYHHVKSWSHITVSDDDVSGISERSADPEGVWVAGDTTSDDGFGALDVLAGSGVTPGSSELPATSYTFFGVDAHITNRVLAVGDSTDSDGTARTLIEQATC